MGSRVSRQATKCRVARTKGVTFRQPVPGRPAGIGDGALPLDGPAEPTPVADLTVLFMRRHTELVRLALLLVGDQATAEDVVQDVFARLHARRAEGPAGEDPLPYIRAAVLNGCRSQLRRRAVVRRFAGTQGPLFEQVTQDSAEQEMIRSQERARVLAALAALPVRRREVLVLRYYVGLSEAEIARVLGISPGTVKSTAARGLAALARRLGEEA
jgi:RNA polymerase sigma-70 factor (sigma-E family)